MNDFWKWLNKKHFTESKILESTSIEFGDIPGQMLIGYMIEYLNENKLPYHLLSLPADYCYLYLKCLIECYNDTIDKDKKNRKKYLTKSTEC